MTAEEFGRAIEGLGEALEDGVGPALHEHGKRLADKAASYLGSYHGEVVNPAMPTLRVPAWDELAPKTLERKKGGDTPLLESDSLRQDIRTETLVRPGPSQNRRGPIWVESVGSDLPYAAEQELGSRDGRTPPRPYLTRALAELHYEMTVKVDDAVEAALTKVFG
jgi:hypothetical protein